MQEWAIPVPTRAEIRISRAISGSLYSSDAGKPQIHSHLRQPAGNATQEPPTPSPSHATSYTSRAILAFLLPRPYRNPEIASYLAHTAHRAPNPHSYRLLKNRSSWDSRTLSPARNVATIAPANPVAGIRQAAMKMFIQPSVDMRQQ